MFDAELLERPADLRQARAVDRAARRRRVEIMAAPVGVEAQGQAARGEHLAEAPQGGGRALLLHQKRRINLRCRVVHRHDQVELGPSLQPLMLRAVLVQHHPRQRAARALAPVRPAPHGPFQQPLRMQEPLRPRVAPRKPVVPHQVFVEMLGREAAIAGAVKSLHLILPIRRNPLARRLPKPPVQKPRLAFVLEPPPPPPKRPLAHTQKLRRIQLAELQGFVTAQDIQKFNHTHTLKGFRPAHRDPPQRGRKLPDRSCAT